MDGNVYATSDILEMPKENALSGISLSVQQIKRMIPFISCVIVCLDLFGPTEYVIETFLAPSTLYGTGNSALAIQGMSCNKATVR